MAVSSSSALSSTAFSTGETLILYWLWITCDRYTWSFLWKFCPNQNNECKPPRLKLGKGCEIADSSSSPPLHHLILGQYSIGLNVNLHGAAKLQSSLDPQARQISGFTWRGVLGRSTTPCFIGPLLPSQSCMIFPDHNTSDYVISQMKKPTMAAKDFVF